MPDNDPIPLEECSGQSIINESVTDDDRVSVRCRRKLARRSCSGMRVCFSPQFDSGKVDPTECPVVDISAGGFSIEYDRRTPLGLCGTITYRAESGLPVHIGCTVRHCVEQMDGLFRLGIKLDRRLQAAEMRPIRTTIGRELAPGIRARKLKQPITG
jgi:hypothetical protein